jgi:trafficking protein particle complex subunit 11
MPGETTLKTLYLKNAGGGGDRVLDISIQSRSPVAQDTSEVLRTLSVPTVVPMKVEYGVKYVHARGPLPGLSDLHTYESDYWDDGEGGEALVSARMACMGPWGVSVETVRLVRKVSLLRPVVCYDSVDFTRMGLMLGCLNALWTKMRTMLLPVP